MDIKKHTFVAGQVEPALEWQKMSALEKYDFKHSALNPRRSRRYHGHISEKTARKWARDNQLVGEVLVSWNYYDSDNSKKGVWTVRETRLTID